MQHLFIPIGTAVSAKFRGAFCEAKVSECTQKLKYKIFVSATGGTASCDVDQVDIVKAADESSLILPSHVDGCEIFPVESTVTIRSSNQVGVIKKLIDASVYTVTFDDADQSQFKRKAIKLKGQKYFKDEENLNTLPLFKPENFGTPAKGNATESVVPNQSLPLRPPSRRSRGQTASPIEELNPILATVCSTSESESCVDDSLTSATEEEESNSVSHVKNWIFNHVDQVVWVDRGKGTSFPGLVIDPWETEKKRDADNHCIVRSFRDNKFFSVPFKYVADFDKYMRSDKPQLQAALDLANDYLTDNVLPKNWFITYWQIYKDVVEYLQDDSVPSRVTSGPFSIEIGRLFFAVWRLGGFEAVSQMKNWCTVYKSVSKACPNWGATVTPAFVAKMKSEYKKYLLNYEAVFESRLAANEDNPLPIVFRTEKSYRSASDFEVKPEFLPPKPVVASEKGTNLGSLETLKSLRNIDEFVHVSYADGKIYPAKIIKVDPTRDEHSGIYFVHYKNWNSRHDQWISEDVIVDTSDLKTATSKDSLSLKVSPSGVSDIAARQQKAQMSSPVIVSPTNSKTTVSKVSPPEQPQSSLSKVLAEKRSLLQNSTSDGAELMDTRALPLSTSPLSLPQDKVGQRGQFSSSSDEETGAKVSIRTPRKLRKRNSSRSNQDSPSKVGGEVENSPGAKDSSVSRCSGHLKRTISAEGSANDIESTLAPIEPSKSGSPSLSRSPPKRRRVVKRTAVSESQKTVSGSPVKLNRIEGQPPVENGEFSLVDEDKKDEDAPQCETNDEGFSADEECDSDDTIDMNKIQDFTPVHEQNENNMNESNRVSVVDSCIDEDSDKLSSTRTKTESSDGQNTLPTSMPIDIKTEWKDGLKLNEDTAAKCTVESTDDTTTFVSPTLDTTASARKKQEGKDHPGTPSTARKTAKRNGKNGEFRHGFFFSDPEDSELEDSVSEALFLNSSGKNQACEFYTIFNSENEKERIFDVSILDDIHDIDERISVAEQQMELIQKRYKQMYREMQKLDNLKRKIRKRKKARQNTREDDSGLKSSVNLSSKISNAEFEANLEEDLQQAGSQASPTTKMDNGAVSMRDETQSADELAQSEVDEIKSSPKNLNATAVEERDDSNSKTGYTEEQMSAIQSLMSLHNS